MKKIKRVLTAIGSPQINNKLKQVGINIVVNDIQYQEGIIEYLEKDNNIDFIIIDEKIPGNFDISELVFNIKKLNNETRIILISPDNKSNVNVYKQIDSVNVNRIVEIIQNNNIFRKQYIPLNKVINKEANKAEIITILGTNGIGKSIFSIIFANYISYKKIAVIDFDILNNSLHTLLGVQNYSEKIQENMGKDEELMDNNIKDFIIKTKGNIDLISGISLIFNNKKQLSPSRIRNIILSIKNEYDLIIIDTSSDCMLEYTKQFIKISNNLLFISGSNLLEIKKSQRLLEIYNKEWNIPKNKISIIFNKYTKQSIDDNVLKRIFKNYSVLGKIRLSDYYDLAINKNKTRIPQIEQDILNIKRKYKIVKNRKLKINKIIKSK